MAMPLARIRFSLLDRLTFDKYEETASRAEVRDPEIRWRRDRDRLIESIVRDLGNLLNTRRRESEIPGDYPEVQNSLLNFGLPDLTTFNLSDKGEQERVGNMIEQTVRRFEPRLSSVAVTVENHEFLLRRVAYRVEAILNIEPVPEAITFNTVFETDSGRCAVREVGE